MIDYNHLQKRNRFWGRFQTGAGKETRTLDPNLGKVVLYQLSYSRKLVILKQYRIW